jgi:hypothetical protein
MYIDPTGLDFSSNYQAMGESAAKNGNQYGSHYNDDHASNGNKISIISSCVKSIQGWWNSESWTPKSTGFSLSWSYALGVFKKNIAGQVSLTQMNMNSLDSSQPTVSQLDATVGAIDNTVPSNKDVAVGAAASLSVAVVITNGTPAPPDSYSPSRVCNFDTPTGSVSIPYNRDTKVYSIGLSTGVGPALAYSNYNTMTRSGKISF